MVKEKRFVTKVELLLNLFNFIHLFDGTLPLNTYNFDNKQADVRFCVLHF